MAQHGGRGSSLFWLRGENARVHPDCQKHDRALDDLRIERRYVDQDQAIAEHGDAKCAEQGADDGAAAPEQIGAAEPPSSDHGKLETAALVERAAAKPGRGDE